MFDEMPEKTSATGLFSKFLWSWRPFHSLVVMSLLLASCMGDGCDCAGFEARPFPVAHYDKTVPVSGQVRLTKPGLDFLGDEIPTLITSVMPDGLDFCLPKSTGGETDMCHRGETCADGSDGCQLSMSLEDTTISTDPAKDSLILKLTVGDVDEQLSIKTSIPVIGTLDCKVKLHKDGAANQPARIPATIPIKFKLDQSSPTKDIKIELGEIDADMSGLGFTLSGGGKCTLASIGASFVKNMVRDMVSDQLNGMVGGMLNSQLCQTCGDDLPACPGNASCDADEGICKYNATQECVARMLGVEGGLMLSELLSDFSQSSDASMDVMVRAADKFKIDDGLSLGLRTGFQPEQISRCAPVDPTQRPAFTEIPLSPTINGNVRPGSGTPFMMGFGLHKVALEHMMWSTWASGGLCLMISSASIDMLSTGAIEIFLPSIKRLVDGNRGLYLQFSPQEAPSIKLGANTVTRSGENVTIDEGLFTLDWKDVDIHMYGFVQERYVRLFTLRTDLNLPISMSPDGLGELQIAIGDLDKAITNIRPTQHGLMGETKEKLAELLPTLMGVALPSLGDMTNMSFALPDVMGYEIVLNQDDITSVDDNTFIALFAELKKATSPLVAGVTGVVQDYQVDVSTLMPSGTVRPVVTLDLVGVSDRAGASVAGELEYSYRLNGGFWSLYQPTSRLVIKDPVLSLQGEHLVEVRARVAGSAGSAQIVPTRVPVVVDYSAPKLLIEPEGSDWKLVGEDVVDSADQLVYRYRIVGDGKVGDWTAWSSKNVVMLDEDKQPKNFRIEAEVRDRAGYEAQADYMVHRKALKASPSAKLFSDGSDTCSYVGTSGGNPSGGVAIFMLLGLGLVIRRRAGVLRKHLAKMSRVAVLLGAVLALVVGSGCSDDPVSGSTDKQKCEEACMDGFVCRAGTCVPQACSEGTDCESGICRDGSCATSCGKASDCEHLECGDDQVGVCTDGGCVCEYFCGGTSCGDGKFCCHESNKCQALPDACAGVTCDPGMEPVEKSAGTGDSATCEISGASCVCEKMAPLPVGMHGEYAAISTHAGADVTAVAVFNSTYHDLMVATLDSALKPTWYTVDGVPESGDIRGAIDGPRGGIRTVGTRVGRYAAIAVDSGGDLHVFYRDATNKSLKYARGKNNQGTYSFEIVVLDSEGDTGFWNSARLMGDTIHLVYTAREDERKSEIRTLSFDVSTAMDALPTTPKVLYSSEVAVDVEVSASPGYVQSTGLFNQLTETPDGMLLVFYDHNLENVAWIRYVNDDWDMPQFMGVPSGPYVSGAIDSSGTLHLAYMDTTIPALVYWKDGSPATVIMNGERDDEHGWVLSNIGEGVSLRLIGDGGVQVMFQDTTRHVLHTATLNSNGWAKSVLAEPGAPFSGSRGFFGTMLIDTGSTVAVEYVIHNQRTPAEGFPVFHKLN